MGKVSERIKFEVIHTDTIESLNTPKLQSILKNQILAYSCTTTCNAAMERQFQTLLGNFLKKSEKCFYEAFLPFFWKVGISDG